MTTLTIIFFLTGAVLGLRFNVLILIPTLCICLAAAITNSVVHGDSVGPTLLAAIVAATACQLGYLGGTFVQLVMVNSRARRLRLVPAPPTRAMSPDAPAKGQF